MNRISFTANRVSDAQCPPDRQQCFLWDANAKGFGLRITANGARSYIYQGKLNGTTIRITIGSPDAWPLESRWSKDDTGKRTEVRRGAREEARRLQGLIDQGIDPRQQRVELQAARHAAGIETRRQALTLSDAWPDYLASRKGKWSARSYDDHVRLSSAGGQAKRRGQGRTEPGPLAALMDVRLGSLDSARIASWLVKEAESRPTSAALSFRLLRAFIRWAEDMPAYRGLVPRNAWNARVVRDVLPRSATKEGDCLQREQLAAWFTAVKQIRNPVISAYLQALLLTGARREEMAGLRWADVDFRWRSITIRDKVEGTRTLPLPPYLGSVLSELPRRNEWVFSSPTSASGRLAEPRIAHNGALQSARLPHLSLHGLRRSFGTLCEWVEMPSGIAAQIMGHKPSALAEKHYRRRPLDLLRLWHDRIETWILVQAGIAYAPINLADAKILHHV